MLKKRILFIALIGISFGIKAQEKIQTEIGLKNDFIYKNGNLALGDQIYNGSVFNILKKPSENEAHLFLGNPTSQTLSGEVSSRLCFAGNGIQHAGLAWIPNNENWKRDGQLNITFGGSQNPMKNLVNFTFRSNGNLGIGSTLPKETLTLSKSGVTLGIYDTNPLSKSNNRISRYPNSLVIQNDFTGDWQDIINFHDSGNVGIGTINPGDWKLAVNGKIRAKEIKVETGWSDFVFKHDYKLPTLTEVENHINKKGHLKDIPSAKEVAENGIFLGKMDSKLLQKIEELTLYTIQQQKEIEELKVQNKKILALQKRLDKLENK